MVLTRSAVRAQNSIIRWLPNEILAAVISEAPHSDLVALCMTSRLIREIATPMLYRVVKLYKEKKLEAFLCTINSSAASSTSLSPLVREVRITISGLGPCPLVDDITASVFRFSRLESLELLLDPSVEFTPLLDSGYFANLATFRYTLKCPSSTTMLSHFVHRHPTITRLTVVQSEPLQQLDPTHAASLTDCIGASAFISFMLRRFVFSVTLSCVPAEPDIDMHVLYPASTSGASPNQVSVLLFAPMRVSVILVGVAAHLPHTRVVGVIRYNGSPQLSRKEVLEIAAHLKNLVSLSTFSLNDYVTISNHGWQYDWDGDEEIVATWSAACKTLSKIAFHARKWERVEGRWNTVE
ncbi:hypothetical protein C8R45DRAFT_1014197 [Mycena sanguinolenta]|nr:hypothetical protein C8R45DRAFT_1014197 [Mycena sanguinolenta]